MGLAVQKHCVVYTLLRRGVRWTVYKTGSKELQAGLCADFLEALGRKQISFSTLITLICKMRMKMFFCFRGQIWELRLKTKDWKAETEDIETRNITILPQASYSTLYMFANYLWSFQGAYLNTGRTLHNAILTLRFEGTVHGWTPSDQEGPLTDLMFPPGSFPVNPTACSVSGMCLKYTALVNTSSANLLLGILRTST